MRRLSLHLGCWFGFAVLALALAASNAGAQMSSVSVSASAGPFTPDWCPAPTDQSSPASAPLTASVANPPVPPYGCSLMPPTWFWSASTGTVLYSPDNSTWSNAPYDSYTFWIVQPDNTSPAATAYVLYNIGGYWQFPCEVGVWYNDSSCGDMWSGNTTCMAFGKSVQLMSLTVVSGATQTNVTGPGALGWDWAAVKDPNGIVTIQATTQPDNADAWAQIVWSGGNGLIPLNQRTVDKSTSAKTQVTASIGRITFFVNVWIIWATVTIQISGKAATDNNCPELTRNGGNWDAQYGGGNALGPKDHDSLPGLTYAYTVGQMQATGNLTPTGIGNIISKNAWKLKRTKEKVAWDNGGHYVRINGVMTWAAGPSFQDEAGTDDTSSSDQLDLDPTSGGSVDTIFDEDAPGCSNALSGITIYHTSEVYQNFTQFITVTLDAEANCSDNAVWSYQAQVDGDKAVGARIDLNKLSTSLISIPNAPHYEKRN